MKGPDPLLAIEVADTSLSYDLGCKPRIYAQYGIEELWVINATKHFNHAPDRLGMQRWHLGQLHRHHLAWLRIGSPFGGNDDVLPEPAILGSHQPHAPLIQQAPNDWRLATFHDFKNLQASGVADEQGDKAFDEDDDCGTPAQPAVQTIRLDKL